MKAANDKEQKKKSGHGGARPGAGRPRISDDDKKKRNHAFYCTKHEKYYLRAVLEQIRAGNLTCTIFEASMLFTEKSDEYSKNKEKGYRAWFKNHDD